MKYLKWVALVLFSYLIVAFLSHVDWGVALKSLVVPTITMDAGYITMLVAILGTTISPYMFFWQANMEVEEEIASGAITSSDPQLKHPRKLFLGRRAINDMQIDINVGMFYSELIMFFIIVSTASTIYKAGAKDVGQLDLAGIAQVLRPLAGDAAYLLFTLGIVGIGLLAIPVLAGSAAYALSEVFGWEEGLDKKFHEAKGFYIAIILATLVGLALVFIGVDPVAALYYSAVINGVVAVPLLVIIFMIGNNKKILGERTSGKLSNSLLIITALLMGGAAAGLFLCYEVGTASGGYPTAISMEYSQIVTSNSKAKWFKLIDYTVSRFIAADLLKYAVRMGCSSNWRNDQASYWPKKGMAFGYTSYHPIWNQSCEHSFVARRRRSAAVHIVLRYFYP